MLYPKELSSLFQEEDFSAYPLVSVPQVFQDSRGIIRNLADGNLGDVAFITSVKGAVRANHVHSLDWHLTFLVSGKMIYQWKSSLEDLSEESIAVMQDQMIYTPAKTPHKMIFIEDSKFIAISGLHRDTNTYETDTTRLDERFFSDVRL